MPGSHNDQIDAFIAALPLWQQEVWSGIGIAPDGLGVVTATSLSEAVAGVLDLLPAHRVWERHDAVAIAMD